MSIEVLKSNMLSLASGPLPTLTNPCDTIPDGKVILFFEAYQESGDAFTDERISFDQNSAAMARVWTNWDAVSDPTLAQILRTTLIGGYYRKKDDVSGKKVTPAAHPYLPGLFCKDIVSVQSVAVSPDYFAGTRGLIPFQLALLTLSYTSRPYNLGALNPSYDGDNQYNPNWVELQIRSANQHSNFGTAIFNFDSDNRPAQLGNFFTQGISYLTFIFHDIPDNQLFEDNAIIPKFAPDLGKVNKKTFFGLVQGTVLADSAQCEPYGDYFNPQFDHYTVTINMIYNSFGWNATPRYDGTYENIHYSGAAPGTYDDHRPYLFVDFLSTFFNSINP